MPSIERTFEVQAPLEQVWSLLSDLERLGACVPGCERVEVHPPDEAEWTVVTRVGFLRRETVVQTHTTQLRPPEHAEWTGEGKELSLTGAVDLCALGPGRTEVTYRGSVRARGPLEQVLNRYIKAHLDGDVEQFVRNLRARLEGSAAPGPGGPPPSARLLDSRGGNP